MKAVIVECSNGAAVALCDDGTFRKLKNKGYSIGQELIINHKPSSKRIVQKLSICASLALVLLSFAGIGSHSLVEPYSYVSLDINPSIEYALNRYDKVISVSGINNEGQQVVSSIESDIKNQNITTALGVTIGQLEKDHYIVQKAYNHVIVSVYSANDTKARSITSRVNTFSAEKSDICSIDTIPVSKEVKDDADSLGITPGKLALIQAVAETTSDSNFNVSEWTNKTVSELETTIQQASSQVPGSGSDPASVNVINSEYLSSVLDENAANKSDNASASATDADKEAGSASTDIETNTDDTKADFDAGGTVSASKPDHSGSLVTSADGDAGSTGSSDKPAASDASSTASSSSTADTNSSTASPDSTEDASDQGASSEKGDISPSKDSESADSGTSPSKDDTSSESGTKSDAEDTLSEDSTVKKDPYPASDSSAAEDLTEETIPESSASSEESLIDDESETSDVSSEDTSSGTASAEEPPQISDPAEN